MWAVEQIVRISEGKSGNNQIATNFPIIHGTHHQVSSTVLGHSSLVSLSEIRNNTPSQMANANPNCVIANAFKINFSYEINPHDGRRL